MMAEETHHAAYLIAAPEMFYSATASLKAENKTEIRSSRQVLLELSCLALQKRSKAACFKIQNELQPFKI
jgi:hypothetical protein